MERPDQGLADQGLEVLQGAVPDDVEHLVHEAVAELEQGVFRRMRPRVLENEGLGFVVGQAIGGGR